MNTGNASPPVLPLSERAQIKALRKLYLTVFLRGRNARGLKKEKAPSSVSKKLGLTLVLYALIGATAFGLMRMPVFTLSLYLHGMTMAFLGMFIAASAGEMLFHKEEGDILLHRPVTPGALLWAKISVLLQVALWLGGAFNLFGLIAGSMKDGGNWLFLPAHAASTAMESLFCAGCVVMVYQLCLRWFGRERLDNLMTMTQVAVAVAAILAGQVAGQFIGKLSLKHGVAADVWWVWALPPAWFAGIDDAIAGGRSAISLGLAAVGIAATALVSYFAFGVLARDYQRGQQALNETVSTKVPKGARRRWLHVMVKLPPLSWWLRDSVERASFLLTAAYCFRDRDVKLRLYPGIAPMLAMPLIFMIKGQSGGDMGGGFGVAFSGFYLGLIPMLALEILHRSQQWQAGDLFRVAPIPGPMPLCNGARRAALCLLTVPILLLFACIAILIWGLSKNLLMFLPGLIALPVFALVPCFGGHAVPLAEPVEEGKAARRGVTMVGTMIVSMALGGIALWSWATGWFQWYLIAELLGSIAVYAAMTRMLKKVRWEPME